LKNPCSLHVMSTVLLFVMLMSVSDKNRCLQKSDASDFTVVFLHCSKIMRPFCPLCDIISLFNRIKLTYIGFCNFQFYNPLPLHEFQKYKPNWNWNILQKSYLSVESNCTIKGTLRKSQSSTNSISLKHWDAKCNLRKPSFSPIWLQHGGFFFAHFLYRLLELHEGTSYLQ
jgi:hypothetical protein